MRNEKVSSSHQANTKIECRPSIIGPTRNADGVDTNFKFNYTMKKGRMTLVVVDRGQIE